MQITADQAPVDKQTPLVSVIVAAYNSSGFLPRCLTSLAAQTFRDFETIVVNSSQENRTAEVVSKFPWVRFYQSPKHLFPHAARNVGIEMARGRLFALTDADCEADPSWLAELLEAHSAGHEIIGGCIDSNARALISRGIYILKYAPYLRGGPSGPKALVATGSMLVSRKVCDSVGNFDGSIFSGDALFSWKAREAGFLPWFEPKAIVVDQDEKYRKGFLFDRFQRGREFGSVRAGFEKWGPTQRLFRFLATPVALMFALLAMGRECLSGKRIGAFASTFPFILVGQVAWCAGEAMGYAKPLTDGMDAIESAI